MKRKNTDTSSSDETSSSSDETSSSSSGDDVSSETSPHTTLFVRYKIIKDNVRWPKMKKLPKGWMFVGRDTCIRGTAKQKRLPTEEQYTGDEENVEKVRKILSDYYSNMKDREDISDFDIVKKINYY